MGKFDFARAMAEAQASLLSPRLFAVLLGQGGAGKSTTSGTLAGKKLFIYFSGEDHGARNATIKADMLKRGPVVPFLMDMDEGRQLPPDETLERTLALLDSDLVLKEGKPLFDAVIFDGLPEFESILVRTNRFKAGCMTDKGKHDGFRESRIVGGLFKEVMDRLKRLHYAGCHIVCTCKLVVQALDADGAVADASPRLMTYSVAEDLVSKFADVLVVGPITREGVTKRKFQFAADLRKISKDEAGAVKKLFNFAPRVAGLMDEDVPELLDADLQEVVKLKEVKAKGGAK